MGRELTPATDLIYSSEFQGRLDPLSPSHYLNTMAFRKQQMKNPKGLTSWPKVTSA